MIEAERGIHYLTGFRLSPEDIMLVLDQPGTYTLRRKIVNQ